MPRLWVLRSQRQLKTYSFLTVSEGRTGLQPRTKVIIRAFVQWTRERISMDEDTSTVNFNVIGRNDLIERYNTNKQWTKNASTMLKNYMPNIFTKNIE